MILGPRGEREVILKQTELDDRYQGARTSRELCYLQGQLCPFAGTPHTHPPPQSSSDQGSLEGPNITTWVCSLQLDREWQGC